MHPLTQPADLPAITSAYYMSEYPGLGITLDEALTIPALRAGLALRANIMHRQRTISATRCHSLFDHYAERGEEFRASICEFLAAVTTAQIEA